MNRLVALAVAATMGLGACGDNKAPTVAAAPEVVSAQPAPPAVEASPVPLPPLPSVTAGDAAADHAAAERPMPVGTAVDSPATDPKGTLTKEEEAKSMPMAAHGNNHSSPSLESSPQK